MCLRRVPGADRAGRARGRGARQHAGARPRARLRRVRRPVREPDARARPRGRAGRARDEAAVHAAAGRRAARGGGVLRQTAARGHARRVLLAAQPGRAGLRGARRAAGRLRPARGRRAAGGALRRGARAEGASLERVASAPASAATSSASTPGRRSRGRKAAGHDVAVCAIGPGIVGTGSRLGHGGLAAANAANAASALGGRPVVARASRRPTSASGTAASPTTRRPCSSFAWARWSSPASPTPRAGARRATGCRSRTWAAAPTRIRRSSPPPTPPASRAQAARMKPDESHTV